MKIFDLTKRETETLLNAGKSIGICSEKDLLEVIRTRPHITSGSKLLNFVYAAVTYPWLLEKSV